MELLAPSIEFDDCTKYIDASKNCEVESILDQPSKKRMRVKKDIFIKGGYEYLDNFIKFIANILTFARFWVKMTEE